jgi:hypothetical protein
MEEMLIQNYVCMQLIASMLQGMGIQGAVHVTQTTMPEAFAGGPLPPVQLPFMPPCSLTGRHELVE